MVENRISQGLKYGLSCCVVWIVYLLEPLPHVAPLDRITYPIADSLALIVMGLLLGRPIPVLEPEEVRELTVRRLAGEERRN